MQKYKIRLKNMLKYKHLQAKLEKISRKLLHLDENNIIIPNVNFLQF